MVKINVILLGNLTCHDDRVLEATHLPELEFLVYM